MEPPGLSRVNGNGIIHFKVLIFRMPKLFLDFVKHASILGAELHEITII